jgi:hypothetical protein
MGATVTSVDLPVESEKETTAPSGPGANDRRQSDLPVTVSHRWRTLALAGGAYLLLSVVVWWNVWSGHPTSTTTCGCGDSSLFTWFLAWPAYAISHGLNPLYSTAMFHPTGVNLLANTAELGVGVVLAPVTWLFGPVATFNVALTLSPALSALAMFVLLRRWLTWVPAAFVGGLLYGFSPFVLVSLTDGHLMLGLGVIPPLAVACLDEIFMRQRRKPVVTGVMLGLLVAVQFFIGTEILTITVLSAGIGIALVGIYLALHRRFTRARAVYIGVALLATAITSGVVLGYPAWFALAGPAHFSGSIWPASILGRGGTTFKNYMLPADSSTAIVNYLHRIGGYQGPALSNQYFGIGLVAVLVGGLIVWCRDRRLWLFAAIGLISAFLSLGLENTFWVPWRLLVQLPLIQNIIPVRFVVVTYFAAAVMLGVIVDHTYLGTDKWSKRMQIRSWRAVLGRPRRWLAIGAGLLIATIALAPVADYLAQTTPMTTQPVVLPTWFRNVAPHLNGHQVLLVFPVPLTTSVPLPDQSAMTWQAVDGMHYTMVGGGGPAARSTPVGVEMNGQRVVASLADSQYDAAITPSEIRAIRQALDRWGVTMVVIPAQSDLPAYDQVGPVSSIAMVMTAAIGARPVHRDSAWVWAAVHRDAPATIPNRQRLAACAKGVASRGVGAVAAAADCVLAAG